jgi:hypothetical protein
LNETLVADGKISPRDMDLFLCTDSPEEVTAHVLAHFNRARSGSADPRDARDAPPDGPSPTGE